MVVLFSSCLKTTTENVEKSVTEYKEFVNQLFSKSNLTIDKKEQENLANKYTKMRTQLYLDIEELERVDKIRLKQDVKEFDKNIFKNNFDQNK